MPWIAAVAQRLSIVRARHGLWLAQLALLPFGVLLVAWFSVHTSSVRDRAQDELDLALRPGGVIDFDHVEVAWGPPLEVTVYGLVVRSRDGEALIDAGRVRVVVDLSTLAVADDRVVLHVESVDISDLDLWLAWDNDWCLTLTDQFTNKAFGLALEKPPPKTVEVSLDAIRVTRSTLRLTFPGFGFAFHGIRGAGTLGVRDGELTVQVPTLAADSSVVWLEGLPGFKRRVEGLPRPGQLEARDHPAEATLLPLTSVHFQDFRWHGDGLSSQLKLSLSEGSTLSVDGALRFPDEGTVHDLSLEASLQPDLVSRLSGGQATGPAHLKLHGLGTDLDAHLSAGPISLAGLDTLGLRLVKLELMRLELDATGERVLASLDGRAASVKAGPFTATDAAARADLRIGWGGFRLSSVLATLADDPRLLAVPVLRDWKERVIADIALGPGTASQIALDDGAALANVILDRSVLRVGRGKVVGNLVAHANGGATRVTAQLGGKPEVSVFSGLKGTLRLGLSLVGVPRQLLGGGLSTVFGTQGGPVSGEVLIEAPFSDPMDLTFRRQ